MPMTLDDAEPPVKTRTTVQAMLALATLVAGALVLPGATPAAAANTARTTYYVSLGDSYSVGYQPGLGATPGYTAFVARRTHLKLVNFGCGGATTTSILNGIGCPDVLPHTAGGVTYPTTSQAAAAEAFITAHPGHIGLITVTIGGNDVVPCAFASAPIPCVSAAVTRSTPTSPHCSRGSAPPRGPRYESSGRRTPM